jgi:glycerol-3-phosphate dehydrogenase (NAD(P)+)
MTRIGVLGAGSWGTALAVHFAGAGHQVALWARSRELADELAARRTNDRYLPAVALPPAVRPTADLEALGSCDLVLVVVPSHGFRAVLRSYLAVHPRGRPAVLVSATKGIETDTLARMSQVAFEEGIAADREVRFAVLSGPSFAAELAADVPTAAVIASAEAELAAELREELATPRLRLYSSADVVGVELGGAAKNVIAVAAGVVSGLELGHNTLAVLVTRGLHEITRLGVAYGGQVRTFSGLSGLGDLVLTCTGGLSRNRRLGAELARGRSLEEATGATPMIAEGVRNSLAVSRLAGRRGVTMPITEQMVQVLYEGKPAPQAVEELMRRDLKAEADL